MRVRGSVGAALIALSVVGCGSGGTPAPVTVTKTTAADQAPIATAPAPAPSAASAAPAAQITIPEVAGQNAEIVRKNLEKLGLTDVSLASANPKYSVVIMAANWTVVRIEPAPGTRVGADDPVVVKVTKE